MTMMGMPPVYQLIAASSTARSLLGATQANDLIRVFSFAETEGQPIDTPYVVWQSISGSPYNCLGDLPQQDARTTQIDIYAARRTLARTVAWAVRDALEGSCYMVNGPTESKELDTNLFRVSMDFDWIIDHTT